MSVANLELYRNIYCQSQALQLDVGTKLCGVVAGSLQPRCNMRICSDTPRATSVDVVPLLKQ